MTNTHPPTHPPTQLPAHPHTRPYSGNREPTRESNRASHRQRGNLGSVCGCCTGICLLLQRKMIRRKTILIIRRPSSVQYPKHLQPIPNSPIRQRVTVRHSVCPAIPAIISLQFTNPRGPVIFMFWEPTSFYNRL